MRMYLFSAIVFAMLGTPALAETLKGGYPGCISKEYLDQFYNAMLRNDETGANYLLEQGTCVLTTSGVKVSVLETDWGTVRVRAYKGQHTVELWTSVANVQH